MNVLVPQGSDLPRTGRDAVGRGGGGDVAGARKGNSDLLFCCFTPGRLLATVDKVEAMVVDGERDGFFLRSYGR